MALLDGARAFILRTFSASERRVARQTLWLNAALGVEFLSGAAQLFLAARILGPDGFGALAVIAAAAALVHGFAAAPGGDAVAAFATRSASEGKPWEAANILRFTLAASLGLSFAAYAIIAAALLLADELIGIAPAHRQAAMLYGLVGVFMATQTETQAALRLADRAPLIFAAAAAAALTRVVLLAAVWRGDGGLIEVAFAYVAGAAVYGAGLFAAAALSARRAGMPGLLRSLSIRVPADVRRFQAGVFGRTTIETASWNADAVLVEQAAGAQSAGLYRAARQIADAARRPIAMMRLSAQTEHSRQWRSGLGGQLRRSVGRFTLLAAALAAIGFGLLAAFREPVTRLLLGDAFSESASLLLILIPGAFAASTLAPFVSLPLAAGRVAPQLWAMGAGLAVSVPAYFWLAAAYGAQGAAFARVAHVIVSLLVLAPFAASALRESRRLRPPPGDKGGSSAEPVA